MQILKSLHAGILHKSFRFNRKDFFCASALIGFDLRDGSIKLEQDVWKAIGSAIGRDNLFDMAMPKDHPEFIVAGSYYAPGGKPVTSGQVSVTLGGVTKALCVQGDRYWRGGLGFSIPSEAQPFTEMPLTYAKAFGGVGYAENEDGIGYVGIELPDGRRVKPLPNIENVSSLITSPSNEPLPASFMPISLLCPRRVRKSGTYDDNWLKTQAPGLADDINWDFFNDTPTDQWLPDFPVGGERYELLNMHPEFERLTGKLPSVVARIFVTANKHDPVDFKELPGRIDTVWFFPSLQTGVMIFRYTCEDHYSNGKSPCIVIAHENCADARRPVAHYRQAMVNRLDPELGFQLLLSFADFLPNDAGTGLEELLARTDVKLESCQLNNQLAGANAKVDAAQQAAEAEKARVAELLKAQGLDPDEYMKKAAASNASAQTEQEKGLEVLFAKLATVAEPGKPIDMKLISELIGELMKIAKDSKAFVEKKLDANIAVMKQDKALWDSLGPEIQARVDAALRARPLLPRPPGAFALEQMRKDFAEYDKMRAELLASGVPEDRIPQHGVDLNAIKGKLDVADREFKNAYRLGAHWLEPGRAPHDDKQQDHLFLILAAIEQNRSVAEWDLAGLDLSGRDFSGVDFTEAFLEDVNFSGAKLVGAKFERAILARANLTDADCSNANFAEASVGAAQLVRTNFSGANLKRVTLSAAHIESTNFFAANLAEAQFLESQISQANFSQAQFQRCNFINIDFAGSTFIGAELSGANFIAPQLENANFSQAVGNEVTFIEANATGANFTNANFESLRFFKDSNLSAARFNSARVERSNFRGTNLVGANFANAKLSSTDFSEANLTDATMVESLARLAAFNCSNLQRCNMSKVDGMEATFFGARLVQANMRDANWYSANFMNAVVGETRFDNCILDHTLFKDWRPS